MEARPIIQHFGLKKDPVSKRLQVYLGEDIGLAVCGTGKIKAAAATGWMLGKYASEAGQGTVAINFGLAGCPEPTVALGSLFLVNKITDHATGRSFYPEMVLNFSLPECSLITFDQPVGEKHLSRHDNYQDLVDMEGSGFFGAASAHLSAERIICLKMVSDHLQEESLDKHHMTSLLEGRMQEMAHVLQVCEKLVQVKKDPLLPADEALLSELAGYLRLTATQRHQLWDWARGRVLRKGVDLEIVRPYLSRKFSGKIARNKLFREIRNELLAE